VLVHGLTFDRSTWAAIVTKLGDDVRTIAVDLPGHGDTEGPPCSLSVAADRLNLTVTRLGIERPIVVGHSMGAAIASIYAASYPTLGVVNIDQPLEIRPFARMVRTMWPALSGPDFPRAFEPFRRSIGVDRVAEPLRRKVLASQDIRQDVVLGYWDELMQTDPDDLQARIDQASSRIASPYLAVFGRELEPSERRKLLNRIPHVQIEEWPGSGHCVHLVEADRFARRLRGFVELCGSTSA
jgi:pimeloyl-ACP methyl ester carboxylesterase